MSDQGKSGDVIRATIAEISRKMAVGGSSLCLSLDNL
jgi:hypothetical protein